MLGDPAARDEGHPAVDDELLAQGEDEHDRERPEDDDEKAVLLEDRGESAGDGPLGRSLVGAHGSDRSRAAAISQASIG